MERKLRKIPEKKMISGVCAGVAYWLGIPTWITRLIWVVATFCVGFGFILYILLWILMPKWESVPLDYEERCAG